MAVVTPTEYYSHGIFPTFQSAEAGGDFIEVPPLASSIILLVEFSADVTFDVVSHASAGDTEAGTAPSNETLDGTSGEIALMRIIPARDEYLINSNDQIELDWSGNSANLQFAAVYRK